MFLADSLESTRHCELWESSSETQQASLLSSKEEVFIPGRVFQLPVGVGNAGWGSVVRGSETYRNTYGNTCACTDTRTYTHAHVCAAPTLQQPILQEVPGLGPQSNYHVKLVLALPLHSFEPHLTSFHLLPPLLNLFLTCLGALCARVSRNLFLT